MPGPSQNAPCLLTISCITMPKEYTSPFCVPSKGGSEVLSNSGDVQRRPKKKQIGFKYNRPKIDFCLVNKMYTIMLDLWHVGIGKKL